MNDTPLERLPRAEIEVRQIRLLQNLLVAVDGNNAFWSRKYAEAGLDLTSVRTLDDFRRLPFSTKQELVDDQNEHPPFGTNLTFPRENYCRLHQTSGTTGRPMRWLDTDESWDWFMRCWSQIYRLAGVTPEDVLAFPFSFGPFIGFWAAFDGSHRQGNLSVPMGGMSTEQRINLISELQATVVCCTPTYALRMAEVAEAEGVDLRENDVRLLIVAGEPGANIPATREKIEAAWGAQLIDHWGMTDIGALGVEPIDAPGGMLILETECIAEIVDADGQQVEPGVEGELIITNLGRIGQPVIRYKTGDRVRAATNPCPSGCELLRLEGGIIGRMDDMVTVRGNNVFPSSIEAILREFDAIAEFRITVETKKSMPHLKIEIEPTPEVAANDATWGLVDQVANTLRKRLNFQAEVVPVGIDDLPRFEMKGRRFVRRDV
ncbi:MAG: AMP-binding protein [Planctomycetaceae bacterium]|nr:AMP-binding protein [Planctomycetaceae bacterium]